MEDVPATGRLVAGVVTGGGTASGAGDGRDASTVRTHL
jgi:hypothetical protein